MVIQIDFRRLEPGLVASGPDLGLRSAACIVLGHVGLFYRWDRLDVSTEAAKKASASNIPTIKSVDSGAMVLRWHNLKQTAFRLGMEREVIFSGPVPRDDVPAYIDAMDICVLPDSSAFGSPIALFEFMAMGKPCVVSDLSL